MYRPALDFPTWGFAAAMRAELKRWTLSQSDIGAGENSLIASATAENEFHSTLVLFQRALQWDTEVTGTSYLMVLAVVEVAGTEVVAYRPLRPGGPAAISGCAKAVVNTCCFAVVVVAIVEATKK